MERIKMDYRGIIIGESLEDNKILDKLRVIKTEITDEPKPEDRWRLYHVNISEKEIDKLMKIIKQGWYAHFWLGSSIIAIFRNKKFQFDYNNKSTWKPAVDYGLSLGIPKEQLDFVIEI
jgi:hypothetical protein